MKFVSLCVMFICHTENIPTSHSHTLCIWHSWQKCGMKNNCCSLWQKTIGYSFCQCTEQQDEITKCIFCCESRTSKIEQNAKNVQNEDVLYLFWRGFDIASCAYCGLRHVSTGSIGVGSAQLRISTGPYTIHNGAHYNHVPFWFLLPGSKCTDQRPWWWSTEQGTGWVMFDSSWMGVFHKIQNLKKFYLLFLRS